MFVKRPTTIAIVYSVKPEKNKFVLGTHIRRLINEKRANIFTLRPNSYKHIYLIKLVSLIFVFEL